MSNLVFVFGTLKEGFPNFSINQGIRIPGIFLTQNRYPFYLVGERFSPWLINEPGKGKFVKGQVFSIDQTTLTNMDQLERTAEPDGYSRETIAVIADSGAETYDVYVYLKNANQLEKAHIQLGPLSDYTLEHASMYKPRRQSDNKLL
ncbi:MAG: gamma-glutamylcyclotransferase family protein [Pseudomonadota bacterium]